MINYDPKHWWRGIFAWAGTVWPQVWGRVAILTGITLALALFALLLKYGFNVKELPSISPLAHTLMGVVLGLLLVFRTNSSYDRYWEGRRLWGGLVNASRNLVRGAAAHCGKADDLAALVAAYVLAVKHTLRGEKDLGALKDLVPANVLDEASAAGNPPTILAFYLSSWIAKHAPPDHRNGNIIRLLEMHLSTMVDCQGGCERILKTPIPFVYAVHLRHLMFAYLVTLPLVLVPIMGLLSAAAVAVVTFSLLGIEEAGIEIEDPFGEDPNDLPLDDICAVIARDTKATAEMAAKS